NTRLALTSASLSSSAHHVQAVDEAGERGIALELGQNLVDDAEQRVVGDPQLVEVLGAQRGDARDAVVERDRAIAIGDRRWQRVAGPGRARDVLGLLGRDEPELAEREAQRGLAIAGGLAHRGRLVLERILRGFEARQRLLVIAKRREPAEQARVVDAEI